MLFLLLLHISVVRLGQGGTEKCETTVYGGSNVMLLKPGVSAFRTTGSQHKPDKIINPACQPDRRPRTKVDMVYKTTQHGEKIRVTGDAT